VIQELCTDSGRLEEEDDELTTLGVSAVTTPLTNELLSSTSTSTATTPSIEEGGRGSFTSTDEVLERRNTSGRRASRILQIMALNVMLSHYNRHTLLGQRSSLITYAAVSSSSSTSILTNAALTSASGHASTTGASGSGMMGATPVSRTLPTSASTAGGGGGTSITSGVGGISGTTTTAGLLRLILDSINHRRMRARLRRLLSSLTPSSQAHNHDGDAGASTSPRVRLHSSTPSNVFAFSILSFNDR
jgi:hypothetical protein